MPGLRILCDRRASKPQEVHLPTDTPPSEPARVPAKQWRPSEDDAVHVQPTIPRLFSDAAAYGKFIADTGSPGGLRRPALGKRRPTVDFADLVGHDLDASEKEQAGRFAQISAADWTSSDDDDSRTRLTEEPEPLTDADSISSSSLSDESESAAATSTPPTSDDSASETSSTALTPEQVVRILEQEFGALAPEGEEKLVFQADGAVIQDVVILVCIVSQFSTPHRTDATFVGCRPCHYASFRVPRVDACLRSHGVPNERHHQGRAGAGPSQRSS